MSSNSMSSNPTPYKHWRIDRDENDIAWIHFDMLDAKANLLSQEAIAELREKHPELVTGVTDAERSACN